MIKVPRMLIGVLLLSGCAVTPHDNSTGEETALIEGCKIQGPLPYERKYYHDGWSAMLVDAGPVVITAKCDPPFWGGGAGYAAIFHFVAEAGHTYTLSESEEGCFQLVDVTANGQVLACEPPYRGGTEGLSVVANKAVIVADGASSNKGDCKPASEQNVYGTNRIYVDTGEITIYARCFSPFFGRPVSVASFDFVAETGHIYTFTASDEECIRLLDITDAEIVLACEPYKEAE